LYILFYTIGVYIINILGVDIEMTNNKRTVNDTKYKDKKEETRGSGNPKDNIAKQPEHPDTQNIKQLPKEGVLNIEVVNGVVVIKKETK
jgi:hypothetical protein